MSDAELEITWLIFHDPTEYDRRLEAYFRLLGENRPWWRLCTEADDPRWRSCIRRAIETIAHEQQVSPRKIADYLDGEEFQRTKQRVFEMATKIRRGQGVA